MKRLDWLLAATLTVLVAGSVSAEETAQIDSDSLQLDFAMAKDLVVEPNWHNLPDDVRRLLGYVGSAFAAVGARPGLANVGEVWSELDFIQPQYPAALHVYSAYSDNISGSLFLLGGAEMKAFVLVAYRNAQDFCIFKMMYVPNLAIFHVREMQSLVHPRRDTTIEPIPKCRPQSLRYALQL